MATNYSDLYPEIRSACNDHGVVKNGSVDTDSYMFRDAVISGMLTLALYDSADYSKSGTTVTPDFTTDRARLILIYQVAVALLVGQVDEMMASNNLTVRQAAPQRQLEYAASMLKRLYDESGVEAGSYDGSLQAIYNHGTRWANRITAVVNAG